MGRYWGSLRHEQCESYLTVWTESVRALVVLHQVSDTGEPRICICSVQCPRVLNQNLTEQSED